MSDVLEINVLDSVTKIVQTTLKIPAEKLDVDAEFESFGMDSIIAMELMANLSKQLKMSLNPAQLTSVNSLRELAALIETEFSVSSQPVSVKTEVPVSEPVKAAPVKNAPTARYIERTLQPRISTASNSIRKLVRFSEQEFGIDLSREVFRSTEELIDYLLEYYPEDLTSYYGLSEAAATGDAPDKKITNQAQQALADIAIVGIACHFPDAPDTATFWKNLLDEHSAIREIPEERWSIEEYYGEGIGKTASKWGALLDDVEYFDADFFGITDEEAVFIDPQERLLLQEVYRALQNAGLSASKLKGSQTGVFVGYEYTEYEHLLRQHAHKIQNAPAISSSSPSYYLANRLSFIYDFNGPSEVVNASCASSALAIHKAAQSLNQGESELAIAAGVSLNLFADDYVAISHYSMLSPNGTCGVFDDNANGFTRGEGVGVLVLKRLQDAERDNNRIYAKLKVSHQNNRGNAAFISEIKHEAITQLISDAYQKGGIESETVNYIEVDGYATKWGDSFEFEGIKNAFSGQTSTGDLCALGSVKGNVGHLEPASGIASTIKVALSLHNGVFPATITKTSTSKFIDLDTTAFYIADKKLEIKDIRTGSQPIRAGINSFSDSGINVHLVLEEYQNSLVSESDSVEGPHLFVLTARNATALVRTVELFRDFIDENQTVCLEDVAYTLQMSDSAMDERIALVARNVNELSARISDASTCLSSEKLLENIKGVFYGNGKKQNNAKLLDLFQSELSEEKLLLQLHDKLYDQVALVWANGINVDWPLYWGTLVETRKAQKKKVPGIIDLPLCSFDKTRYWLDVTPESKTRKNAPKKKTSKAKPAKNKEVDLAKFWAFTKDEDASKGEALSAREKIQLFLTQASSQILKVQQADLQLDNDFIQLGFDSIGIAELIQQVIELVEENISPSVVFRYQDIPSFAQYLANEFEEQITRVHVLKFDGAEGGQASLLNDKQNRADVEKWFTNRQSMDEGIVIPMQTAGKNSPIFACPGADGSVLSLQPLSQAFQDRPFFGFEAVGMDGKQAALESIEEMAKANIDALQSLKGGSKVNILGYSNGAVVAYEMAKALSKTDTEVESLILVDCVSPSISETSEADEISSVITGLISIMGGNFQLNEEEFNAVPQEGRADYLYAILNENGFPITEEQFLTTFNFAVINDRACRNYTPVKFDNPANTLLLRSTQENTDLPEHLGWNDVLEKPVIVKTIDADHITLVGGETCPSLVDAIESILK